MEDAEYTGGGIYSITLSSLFAYMLCKPAQIFANID